MSELKPCPFCGGAGREVIRFYEEGAATSIRCQTCNVVTAPFLHIPEAIAAWNNRHGEDTMQHCLHTQFNRWADAQSEIVDLLFRFEAMRDDMYRHIASIQSKHRSFFEGAKKVPPAAARAAVEKK